MDVKTNAKTNIKIDIIEVDTGYNVIVGRTHFIKSVEDIYEAIVSTNPNGRFGLSFCEASGDLLIRCEGNDDELIEKAVDIAKKVNAGHYFFIVMKDMYPINIIPRLRQVPEVCYVECASQNPINIIIGETALGRTILGIVDGKPTVGVEDSAKKKERKEFLRKIGYKF